MTSVPETAEAPAEAPQPAPPQPPDRPPAWRSWVRNATILACGAWFLWNVFGGGRPKEHDDLPSFWCGAQAAFVHGRSPYDHDFLQTIGPEEQYVHPFVYPPPALFVYRPLASFSYDGAVALMDALNLAAVLFLMWFLPARILRASWRREPLLWAATSAFLLLSRPLLLTFHYGQVNLFATILLLVAWDLLRSDRSAPAAACLALAALVKPYPLLALPFLAAAGKTRACLQTAGILAAVSALSLVAPPSASWEGWFLATAVLQESAAPRETQLAVIADNQGLNGLAIRLLTPHVYISSINVDPSLAVAAVSLFLRGGLVLAALRALLRRFRTQPEGALDWAMLFFPPTMFLAAPLAWQHHLTMVYGTILLLWKRIFQGSREAGWGRLVTLGAGLHICLWPTRDACFTPVLMLWCICLDAVLADPGPILAPPSDAEAAAQTGRTGDAKATDAAAPAPTA